MPGGKDITAKVLALLVVLGPDPNEGGLEGTKRLARVVDPHVRHALPSFAF